MSGSNGPEPNGIGLTVKEHHDTYEAIKPTRLMPKSTIALITGASKGIGRSTALSFAQAGVAGLCLAARSDLSALESEIKKSADSAGKQCPKILCITTDVQDRASVEEAAERVRATFGRLDILINNAGVLEESAPIADSDPDVWWGTWETNIRGSYLVTRAFLPLLLESEDKTVVNISSVGAHVTRVGASAYQMTKFALLRFSEFLVAEYGEKGLLSFAVHPGGVMTELAKNMPSFTHHFLIDTPELGADTMVYLLHQPQRQDWLAGRYISVLWDMPEFFAMKDTIVAKDLLKVRLVVQ